MKIILIAALVTVLLAVPAAGQDKPGGSDRPGGGPNRDSSGNARKGPPPGRLYNPSSVMPAASPLALPPGIGVCLIGDNYAYIIDYADAEKCDAVMWVNTVTWADNQRKLIDQSTLAGDSTTTADGATICRSCSGTCQTVSLPIEDSNYEDVEADGGQSPGECLADIRKICESGSYRHFASARCGN